MTAKSLCAEVDVGVTAAAHSIAEHSGRAYVLPIDIAGQFAGTAGGMMNTGFGVAGMISPIVFGVLIQRTGRYELPLFISAGLLLGWCAVLVENRSDLESSGPSVG